MTTVTLAEGDPVPAFDLPLDTGGRVSAASLRGQPFVIYFYPRDDTSGCTKEAVAFSELYDAFRELGVTVIGVSRDPLASHAKFRQKHGLTIMLASDEDGRACEAFGVWVEKSMYGRKSMGIDRSTFLVGPDGRIARIWRKVKVPGHAQAVLDAARALITGGRTT